MASEYICTGYGIHSYCCYERGELCHHVNHYPYPKRKEDCRYWEKRSNYDWTPPPPYIPDRRKE